MILHRVICIFGAMFVISPRYLFSLKFYMCLWVLTLFMAHLPFLFLAIKRYCLRVVFLGLTRIGSLRPIQNVPMPSLVRAGTNHEY